jgi:dihydrofolate synthase/folylpolyglutamate synthase
LCAVVAKNFIINDLGLAPPLFAFVVQNTVSDRCKFTTARPFRVLTRVLSMEDHQYPPALANLIRITASRLPDTHRKHARIRALLAENAALLARCKIIKVTGTNGKGSVCAMLSSCLAADRRTVGLFTSPHLLAINERICINGQPVADATLAAHALAWEVLIKDFIARHGVEHTPAFFEVLILLALSIFDAAGVEFAIFEAGIGGFNDATHLLPSIISAITSIGMDHMDQLGGSLAQIARDKAGIGYEGTPLVLGPRIAQDLIGVIGDVCRGRNIRILEARFNLDIASADMHGTTLRLHLPAGVIACTIALIGPHQIDNYQVVARIVQWLHENTLVSSSRLLTAVRHTVWPGRMEYIIGQPRWLFDVAHNAHAFAVIGDAIDPFIAYHERIIVYGASEEKDYPACIPAVAALAPDICLVGGFNKAVPVGQLASHFSNPKQILSQSDSILTTIRAIIANPAWRKRTIIVLGSLYLVGMARKIVADLGHAMRTPPADATPDNALPGPGPGHHAACEALIGMPKFGNGMGLHRMLWMREAIRAEFDSDPSMPPEAIKITGSNGKGSVSAMLSAILDQLGVRHGLYTSPHLIKFNERIKINGRDIPDAELLTHIGWFEAQQARYLAANPGDTPGAFEAFTGIAMHYFAANRVPTLVLEAGIGGRYDPVRVNPGRLTALTSLDLDHTYLLGDTLEQIAYNKADLCDPGGVLVLGQVTADILKRLRAYCQLKQIELIAAQDCCSASQAVYHDAVMEVDLDVDGMHFARLHIGLSGAHQANNAAVAILLARQWCMRTLPMLAEPAFMAAVRAGLSCVRWPGRYEQVHHAPDVLVDVGHSPGAIDALVDTLQRSRGGQKILLVTGVSHDKNVLEIVSRLLAAADEIICTRAHHKGAPVEQIAAIVSQAAPGKPCHQAATIEQAMTLALAIAKAKGMTVLVAGGLFLSIEAKHALQGGDPQQLRFF